MTWLQPKDSRLPPDVAYTIDCMADDNEIDHGSLLTLKLYGDRPRLMQIVDGAPDRRAAAGGEWRSWRDAMQAELFAYADAMLPQIEPQRRGGLIHCGLTYAMSDCAALATFFADWAYEDSIQGGCAKDYLDTPRVTRAGQVWKRTERRLHAPSWIRRYVRTQKEAWQRRALAKRLAGRMALVPDALICDDGSQAILAALEVQRDAARAREWEQLSRIVSTEMPVSLSDTWVDRTQAEPIVRLKPKALAQMRKRRKISRKATGRALVTAGAVLNDPEMLDLFIKGERVTVLGDTLFFSFCRARSIFDRGHGALDVYVGDMATGKALAELCTYIEDLPTLDQLTAFVLQIRTGGEMEVLQRANLAAVTPEGQDHPAILQRRLEQERAEPALRDDVTQIDARRGVMLNRASGRMRLTEDRLHDLKRAYWEKTGAFWVSDVREFVLGPRLVKRLRSSAAKNLVHPVGLQDFVEESMTMPTAASNAQPDMQIEWVDDIAA